VHHAYPPPQRRHELARIDGVIGLDLQREPDRRRQRRLQPARLRRPQPLDRQPEPAPELGQPVQRWTGWPSSGASASSRSRATTSVPTGRYPGSSSAAQKSA
jgi:anti-sigma factor ChrR (cupin superfamily)